MSPGIQSVDQYGLELVRDLPSSASRVLRSKVCATMPGSRIFFKVHLAVMEPAM